MMKRKMIQRGIAVMLSVMMTLVCLPAIPAAAADQDQVSLRISKVSISEGSIPDNRIMTVDVQIEGNEKGFLAAEFGIAFDSRIALQSIQPGCEAAEAFVYSCTSENHMIWFSGSNAKAEKGATEGKTTLFTLDFVLPEDYRVGDVYVIEYEWNGIDGASGFWYTDKKTDMIDSLMTYSRTGSISIPSQDAPHLNKTAVELNPGETAALTVENAAADGVWFSDNESVATVSNGVITAVAPGECVISVFLDDASSLLSCDVAVRSTYVYNMFDAGEISIFSPDQTVKLEYPGAVGTVTWVSSNPTIATVDEGELTALREGTVNIIATNNGISKMKSITIEFVEPDESTTTSTTTVTTTSTTETTTESTSVSTTVTTTESTTETTTTTTETTAETTTTTTEPTEETPLQPGDISGDGEIDIMDAILLNKNLLGLTTLEPANAEAADVYHDGKINANDSLYLLKYILEMIKTLPVEPK